ncbi:MAG TPA: trypsin-like peptidase domain-containing protein [Planctomycetaceae bacterium]|nr:trypsin-like peptidase domain-containing protein [Planctomycetaceae bacterium]
MQSLTRLAALCLALLIASAGSVQAQSTRDTIAAVAPKMVKIFGAGGLQRLYSYSTGFLVSPQGHIVTVWSHVLDADTVTVILHDGRKFEGKVLGAEPQLDLAVLKIDGDDLPFFDLESEIQPNIDPGTRVLAFSNMFKVATGDEPVSVMHGVIAAQTKLSGRRGAHEVPYTGPVYIVDAITNNPGSGGGLLTTRNGKLLAMVGKEIRNTQSNTWINYAIPLGELKTPIAEIISGRFTTKPTGPDIDAEGPPRRYAPLDFGLVMVPDVLFRTPAFVDNVVPGSAAAKAGLKSDDLVLFVNNELIQSCKSLADALGKLESGDTLRLVVRRDGKLVTVELPVEKKGEE